MSKPNGVFLRSARWWQRDPASGLIFGWAVILGGATIGLKLTQIVLQAGS